MDKEEFYDILISAILQSIGSYTVHQSLRKNVLVNVLVGMLQRRLIPVGDREAILLRIGVQTLLGVMLYSDKVKDALIVNSFSETKNILDIVDS